MSIATETSTNHVKSLNGASEAAYRQAADAVLRGLGADGGFGLSEAEARARLEKHGRNELTLKSPCPPGENSSRSFKTCSLLATQILSINLVTDGAPALALASIRPTPA